MAERRLRWYIIWIIESLALFAAAVIVALTEWLPIIVSNICLFAVYPLVSAFAAYYATRVGLNNYAAWIPAPVLYELGYYLIWGGYPPAGPMLLSMLLAIVGAAAGETKNQFERRRKR